MSCTSLEPLLSFTSITNETICIPPGYFMPGCSYWGNAKAWLVYAEAAVFLLPASISTPSPENLILAATRDLNPGTFNTAFGLDVNGILGFITSDSNLLAVTEIGIGHTLRGLCILPRLSSPLHLLNTANESLWSAGPTPALNDAQSASDEVPSATPFSVPSSVFYIGLGGITLGLGLLWWCSWEIRARFLWRERNAVQAARGVQVRESQEVRDGERAQEVDHVEESLPLYEVASDSDGAPALEIAGTDEAPPPRYQAV
ncbi:hypothetical protein BC830DRAFT_59615 [Chytriomyces sp. MP71]|nr:hypothetical protein BC830DRAFT_59615 [Chytriomyces sp. MP71]